MLGNLPVTSQFYPLHSTKTQNCFPLFTWLFKEAWRKRHFGTGFVDRPGNEVFSGKQPKAYCFVGQLSKGLFLFYITSVSFQVLNPTGLDQRFSSLYGHPRWRKLA